MKKRIVLLRHGESLWNKENRFTGWYDVDLTERGIKEAINAGLSLKNEKFEFNKAYTSFFKRAIKTLYYVLDVLDRNWIPIEKCWKLNEKHYGALQGLNINEAYSIYGHQVDAWKSSYHLAPAPLDTYDSRSPYLDVKYKNVNDHLPLTESLLDAYERIIPYWNNVIMNELNYYNQLLVVLHANSIHAILKNTMNISNEDITLLDMPTAIPYIIEFDNYGKIINDYFLSDTDESIKFKNIINSIRKL